ncbi:CHASE2 domain-containing protein [Magnetospirillum sulfuroxidans]|uniref:histidine kinase n=1 Tax=Magnetospirillum sulfuroxidans TaxID=611300 RepID=A0ABS5IBK9_9PROT|nr:CHASE2 domain-containing protein [Magnetospirillum sulfuroxidans]
MERTGRVAAVLSFGRGRPLGLAVLTICLAAQVLSASPVVAVRNALFDGLQALFLPKHGNSRVSVVEIDEKSLESLGQWPWPRSLTARLVAAVQQAKPVGIGLAMVMPEPDRSSPDVLALSSDFPPEVRLQLSLLPGHDRLLAQAIAAGPAPVTLGVAGLVGGLSMQENGPLPPVLLRGDGDSASAAIHYDDTLRSRPELERAAAGLGLISVERDADGVVRRLPLLAWANGHPFPALAVEMLRLAVNAPALEANVGSAGGIDGIVIGGRRPPVLADGTSWLHFDPYRSRSSMSAVDVLDGKVNPSLLHDHLVLIGVTGLGLVNEAVVAVGDSVPAVHVHAQLLQSLLDDTLLSRPSWMVMVEAAVLLVLGLGIIVLSPRVSGRGFWVLGGLWLLPLPYAAILFQRYGVLFDGAVPLIGAGLVFMAMIVVMSAEDRRQRHILHQSLEEHRLRMAHLGGELASERRAAEDRLQFIDMISHEYRTPLAVLRTGLDVLELRLQETPQTKALSRMRRAVIRLSEIVDVGLARARLDATQIPVERKEIDLGQCLDEAVVSVRAAHVGRSVVVDGPKPAPMVLADPPMLKTALLNLIDNALKYSDHDVFVSIRLAEGEEPPTTCRLVVADEGIGMSATEMTKVFDKFYRTPTALTKPGTGMGLGITRRIIELHDGSIDLRSRPGEGTTVTVTLPLGLSRQDCSHELTKGNGQGHIVA